MAATGDSARQSPALTRVELALGMIVFGSATPVSALVTAEMPVFVGALMRVAIGALALAPLAWTRRGQVAGMTRGDWGRLAAIAVFGMFSFTVLLLTGMALVSGVVGSILMATTPAATAAASVAFLGERATLRRVAAVALAGGGVAITAIDPLPAGPGGGPSGLLGPLIAGLDGSTVVGGALVLGAVACEVVYSLVGRRLAEGLDPVMVAFLGAAASIPLFLPFAAAEWPAFDPASVSTGAWIAVVWYGAGTLSLGSWLWYAGLSRSKGSVAAAFMGLMPLSALALSALLLGETPSLVHFAGFAVVLGAVGLISLEHAGAGACEENGAGDGDGGNRGG